jgi:hypothetical protein
MRTLKSRRSVCILCRAFTMYRTFYAFDAVCITITECVLNVGVRSHWPAVRTPRRQASLGHHRIVAQGQADRAGVPVLLPAAQEVLWRLLHRAPAAVQVEVPHSRSFKAHHAHQGRRQPAVRGQHAVAAEEVRVEIVSFRARSGLYPQTRKRNAAHECVGEGLGSSGFVPRLRALVAPV